MYNKIDRGEVGSYKKSELDRYYTIYFINEKNYFFVGNGFDIFVGLKTKYKDFYQYYWL